MGRNRKELPIEVDEVRLQIEQWRQTRAKRTPMPAQLWRSSALLAEVHGIHPICRALRLSYESLKKHVMKLGGKDMSVSSEVNGFMEVTGMDIVQPPGNNSAEVELVGRQGQRMVMRLCGYKGLDFGSLVAEFWRGDR